MANRRAEGIRDSCKGGLDELERYFRTAYITRDHARTAG